MNSGSSNHNPMLRQLAARAMGMTGADIERIVKEARIRARREKRKITLTDIETAIRQNRPVQSEEHALRTAVHEVGHALVHYVLDVGPIAGVTIESADGAYGALGFEKKAHHTWAWADRILAMLLAGRAAECLIYGEPSAGAGGEDDSDLAKATTFTVFMERATGLGEDLPLLYRSDKNPALVLDRDRALAKRVHDRLEKAEVRATEIIIQYRQGFDCLVDALKEAKALEGTDVIRILNEADVKRDPVRRRPKSGARGTLPAGVSNLR